MYLDINGGCKQGYKEPDMRVYVAIRQKALAASHELLRISDVRYR